MRQHASGGGVVEKSEGMRKNKTMSLHTPICITLNAPACMWGRLGGGGRGVRKKNIFTNHDMYSPECAGMYLEGVEG